MATNSTAYTLRAGKMDRRITIQSQLTSVDSMGGAVSTWSDRDTVWAEVVPMRSEERLRTPPDFSAIAERSVEALLFRVRYRTDITMSDRIVYSGTGYSVVGIQEIGRREAIEIKGVMVSG